MGQLDVALPKCKKLTKLSLQGFFLFVNANALFSLCSELVCICNGGLGRHCHCRIMATVVQIVLSDICEYRHVLLGIVHKADS